MTTRLESLRPLLLWCAALRPSLRAVVTMLVIGALPRVTSSAHGRDAIGAKPDANETSMATEGQEVCAPARASALRVPHVRAQARRLGAPASTAKRARGPCVDAEATRGRHSAAPGPTNHSGSAFTSESSSYDLFGSPASPAQSFETLDKYGGGRFFSATSKRNAEFELTDITGVLGDSKFASSTISRDVAGRITGVKNRYRGELWEPDPKPGAKEDDVIFYRGPSSSTVRYKPNGQVDFISGYWIDQALNYDERGLLSERSVKFERVGGRDPVQLEAGTFRYSYDAAGRNTRLIYPEGYERQQQFDALGRLTSRCYVYTPPLAQRCYTATYDAVGNPKVLTDPEMRREVEYDNLDRVTEVRRYVPADGTTPVYTEHYAYNALGGFTVYDNVTLDDRRPRLDGSGTASAGLPATVNGAPLNLDGAGRVTGLSGNSFRYYGADNRLQAIGDGGGERRFAYDPLGRGVGTASYGSSSVAATRTGAFAYLYNGLEDNVAAFDGSGLNSKGLEVSGERPTRVFIYDGTDHPLWAIDVFRRRTFYYELDTLGNVRRLHSSQDASSGERKPEDCGGYAYTAFGRTLTATEPGGSDGVTVSSQNYSDQPYRWQGRIYLGNNLYDFRARVWSTELGAFLQPDQYAFLSRGGTLWSWPGQNPFRWRDRYGRYGWEDLGNDFYRHSETALDVSLGVAAVGLGGLLIVATGGTIVYGLTEATSLSASTTLAYQGYAGGVALFAGGKGAIDAGLRGDGFEGGVSLGMALSGAGAIGEGLGAGPRMSPGKYGFGNCERFANDLQARLQAQGKTGTRIEIRPPGKYYALRSAAHGDLGLKGGDHFAIESDGKIYDNFRQGGVPADEFWADLEESAHLRRYYTRYTSF